MLLNFLSRPGWRGQGKFGGRFQLVQWYTLTYTPLCTFKSYLFSLYSFKSYQYQYWISIFPRQSSEWMKSRDTNKKSKFDSLKWIYTDGEGSTKVSHTNWPIDGDGDFLGVIVWEVLFMWQLGYIISIRLIWQQQKN